jgi:malate/lactate dehydrogenase
MKREVGCGCSGWKKLAGVSHMTIVSNVSSWTVFLSPWVATRAVSRRAAAANIAIIEGNQASQFGIGIVSARIVEAVLRDERVVIPIGSYNPTYGATLSMPSVVGRAGVLRILEPSMSEAERHTIERSADRLRAVADGFATAV